MYLDALDVLWNRTSICGAQTADGGVFSRDDLNASRHQAFGGGENVEVGPGDAKHHRQKIDNSIQLCLISSTPPPSHNSFCVENHKGT